MDKLEELIIGDVVTWGRLNFNSKEADFVNHCDDDDADGIGDDGMDGPEVDED